MRWLLRLFGLCLHLRYSWPQTAKGAGQATVACLDCGARISYDWEAMKLGEEVR